MRFSVGGLCSFQKVAYKPSLSAVFGSLGFSDRQVFSLVLTKNPSKSKAMKAIESQVSVRFLTIHQLFFETNFSSTMFLYSL